MTYIRHDKACWVTRWKRKERLKHLRRQCERPDLFSHLPSMRPVVAGKKYERAAPELQWAVDAQAAQSHASNSVFDQPNDLGNASRSQGYVSEVQLRAAERLGQHVLLQVRPCGLHDPGGAQDVGQARPATRRASRTTSTMTCTSCRPWTRSFAC